MVLNRTVPNNERSQLLMRPSVCSFVFSVLESFVLSFCTAGCPVPHSFPLYKKFTINKGSTCSEKQFVPSEDLEFYGLCFQSLCKETLLRLNFLVCHFI